MASRGGLAAARRRGAALDLPAESADAHDTAPVLDGVDAFDYDATVGTAGGLWSGGVPFGLSGDQRGDEAPSWSTLRAAG